MFGNIDDKFADKLKLPHISIQSTFRETVKKLSTNMSVVDKKLFI